jgi:hypothetical protein
MNISVAMTWILFLALFPIAFYWLRRAWRIIVKRDYSEVALKGGLPPPNAAKYAPYTHFRFHHQSHRPADLGRQGKKKLKQDEAARQITKAWPCCPSTNN